MDYSKKVKAAKKVLGEKWCLHPANRVKKREDVPLPYWRKVAQHLQTR